MSWKEILTLKRHSGVALTFLRRPVPCSGNEGGTERLTAWAQIGLLRAVCCPHSELSCFPGPDLGAVNKVRSHTAVSPDIKPTSCRSPKCPRGQVDTAPGLGFALVGWVRKGGPGLSQGSGSREGPGVSGGPEEKGCGGSDLTPRCPDPALRPNSVTIPCGKP